MTISLFSTLSLLAVLALVGTTNADTTNVVRIDQNLVSSASSSLLPENSSATLKTRVKSIAQMANQHSCLQNFLPARTFWWRRSTSKLGVTWTMKQLVFWIAMAVDSMISTGTLARTLHLDTLSLSSCSNQICDVGAFVSVTSWDPIATWASLLTVARVPLVSPTGPTHPSKRTRCFYDINLKRLDSNCR